MSALGEYTSTGFGTGPTIGTPVAVDNTVLLYLRVESQAAPISPTRSGDLYESVVTPDAYVGPLGAASADDISSQNLQAPGGATQ
ncbi:MAG: hypothetical protein AB7I30_17485, partial [Isosphaeraceae bacterium]